MSPRSPLPFGTALALAQRTLTAPLAAVLETENLGMLEWFILNTLGLRGPTPVDVLADLLATNGQDASATQKLTTALARSGLITVNGSMASLTQAGTTRYATLRTRIDQVTARIFEQFDAQQVETARSLLQEIADTDPNELTRRSVRAV
jgi:hypothetical protein